MKIERRYQAGIDIRVEGDQPAKISGYAAVFEQPTQIGGSRWGWKEVIKAGAFSRALRESQDVRALVGHDTNQIIGRVTAGTLVLREDVKGLAYDVSVPDTQVGRDLIVSVTRGDITGSSFGFRTKTDNWRTINGEDVRELIDLDLIEVSPVAFPAYEGTSVQVRALYQDEEQDDRVYRALFRDQRGLPLSDDDQQLLAEVRSRLRHKTQPPEVDPAIARELARKKRILQLKLAA